ncbi:metallophosphoesterase [bacterium]|nr:metallophosphoesterase [bacterium]MCI0603087.1 metallophosphoesterase [bacterium]
MLNYLRQWGSKLFGSEDVRKWAVQRVQEGYTKFFEEGPLLTGFPPAIERKEPELLNWRDVTDQEIRIAHISDLHFGANDPVLTQALKDSINRFRPHLTIATGDIVESPSKENRKAATEFLEYIFTCTKKCFVLPGNHDRHGEIDLTQWENDFGITGGSRHCYLIEMSDHRFVTLFLLDSTIATISDPYEQFFHDVIQVRGWIDGVQLEWIDRMIDYFKQNKWQEYRTSIKIAALHHHPLPTRVGGSNQQFLLLANAGQVIEKFCEMDIDLVLHGHQHDPVIQTLQRLNYRPFYILGAGSALKKDRKKKLPNSYYELEVNINKGFVWVNQRNALEDTGEFAHVHRSASRFEVIEYLKFEVRQINRITLPSGDTSVVETRKFKRSELAKDTRRYVYLMGSTINNMDEVTWSVKRKVNSVDREIRKTGLRLVKEYNDPGDKEKLFLYEFEVELPDGLSKGPFLEEELHFEIVWPKLFSEFEKRDQVEGTMAYPFGVDKFTYGVSLDPLCPAKLSKVQIYTGNPKIRPEPATIENGLGQTVETRIDPGTTIMYRINMMTT